jgi:hypothetical protein
MHGWVHADDDDECTAGCAQTTVTMSAQLGVQTNGAWVHRCTDDDEGECSYAQATAIDDALRDDESMGFCILVVDWLLFFVWKRV